MPTKLIAIYATPDDQASFDRYYDEVHTPLARAVPGLVSLRVTRATQRLMGDADVYLVAELDFGNEAAFAVAMDSAENKAAGRDLANFAKGRVTLLSS